MWDMEIISRNSGDSRNEKLSLHVDFQIQLDASVDEQKMTRMKVDAQQSRDIATRHDAGI